MPFSPIADLEKAADKIKADVRTAVLVEVYTVSLNLALGQLLELQPDNQKWRQAAEIVK